MEQRPALPVDRYPTNLFGILASAFAVVLGTWMGWWLFGIEFVARRLAAKLSSGTEIKLQELGQAGDLFGGFSALFSALAFVGVAVAAYLQRETIRLQELQRAAALEDSAFARREAKEGAERAEQESAHVRREVRESAERAERQHARQSFEPLFFRLLEVHRENTRTLKFPELEIMGHGLPGAVQHLRGQIREFYWQLDGTADGAAHVTIPYVRLYDEHRQTLGPYFRTLYHLFKLIDTSALDEATKVQYANIARGTLGEDEVMALALDCMTPLGVNFRPLVERYGLLKHFSRKIDVFGDEEGPTVDEQLIKTYFLPSATQSFEERRASSSQLPSA